MDVIVDGVIFQLQTRGGISRLYSEILPRMCCMDESLHMTLLTQGWLKQEPPKHPRITHCSIPQVERYLRPERMRKWVASTVTLFVRQLWIGQGAGRIWHSTYYTMPKKWNGHSIVTVADMIYDFFPDLFSGLYRDQLREIKRRCVQGADAVICISESTRQDVERFYGLHSDLIYVVPLACSDAFRQLERWEDEPEILNGQPFLVYLGSRIHYKNFEALIKAYSVWSRGKDVALVVVGRPWSADEEKRLETLGVQNQVHLLRDVDDETLCYLYNRAIAFVYPSLYEGFGIPLLEAMACGCPIIASHIPSTIEVAGECPIYFEPTEVDDLVNAFDTALSEGRKSVRVQAGLERVRRYSWDKTAAQTLAVYRTVSGV